ncbi:hypothetical protein K504DRAFT_205621 [Pleomassaria siparia CBS 279.74]|uniref:Uncharacterized protein n=1 Tax=Pleomassaria siparia CBS 279.74 TaxID=1314801 RepID=A0A6G1KHW0_9PLEO|nr:hypothetical protein K504DRAFT_205621 [Pleomassaria siparia CBS 279.74]
MCVSVCVCVSACMCVCTYVYVCVYVCVCVCLGWAATRQCKRALANANAPSPGHMSCATIGVVVVDFSPYVITVIHTYYITP